LRVYLSFGSDGFWPRSSVGAETGLFVASAILLSLPELRVPMKAADEPKCAVQPTVTLGRDTGVPSQAKYFVACRQSSLSLLLRGWWLQAVEAEVHGGGAVMVGPVIGEGDQSESPRCFAAAPELNRIA
jgi:hypothetical protein